MSFSSGFTRLGASSLINLVKSNNIQARKFKPVRVFHSSSIDTQTAGSSSIKLHYYLLLLRNFFKSFFAKGAVRKRFYKKVGTVQSNKEFEVTLDNRKLKTPAGQIFRVSSEPLALAIANEWDAQDERILISSMHMVIFKSIVILLINNKLNFISFYLHRPLWLIQY